MYRCIYLPIQRYDTLVKRLVARRKKANDINAAIAEIDNDPMAPVDQNTLRADLKA